MSHKTAPFRTPVLCGNRRSGVQEFKRYSSTVNRVFVSCSVMIKSSLPDMSHKTAPFRTPVLCGNRSSGGQTISVNRQPCFCLMQWYDRELIAFGMSHRTAPPEPLFSVGTGAQSLYVNRQVKMFSQMRALLEPANGLILRPISRSQFETTTIDTETETAS